MHLQCILYLLYTKRAVLLESCFIMGKCTVRTRKLFHMAFYQALLNGAVVLQALRYRNMFDGCY